MRIDVLQRLDDILYDARLRATMPRTLDKRIVIVDIDEKILAEVGSWPWGVTSLPCWCKSCWIGSALRCWVSMWFSPRLMKVLV